MSRGISVRDLTPEQLARCAPGSVLLELARRQPRRDLEHAEQVKLFTWARQHEREVPALRLLYAIPNFSGRGFSPRVRQRDGARLKAEGRKQGMLDICLPVARGSFHGLYMELKVPGGHPTKEQRRWSAALRAEGYRAEIVIGWEGARDLIRDYVATPRV